MSQAPAAPVPRDALLYASDIHFWKVVFNPFLLLNKRLLGNANVILRRRHEFHTQQAAAFSDALRDTGVPAILLGGDFTSTALEDEFIQAAAFARGLAQRGLRVVAMPGNHDVYTFSAARGRRFERHFREFLETTELPARLTLQGGTPLVLAPTVCPNLVSSRGRITPAQIADTVQLVHEAPEGPVLVAGHYPVIEQTPNYNSAWSRRLRNAEAFRHALGETGRQILYLAGHVHRFSYVQDNTWPNLRHCTTAAFFLQRPGQAARGAFSEITVGDGGFQVYRHTFDGSWTRTQAKDGQAQRAQNNIR